MKGNVSTGFALTLIALFALVFGTVFWLMGKRTITEAPVTQTTQVTSREKQAENAKTQKYVEVKELGFKIPVDDAMADDLTYTIVKPDGVPFSSANFSSKTLNAVDKDCSTLSGMQIQKISGTPAKNPTGESDFYSARTDYIKQFDGFFLLYQSPQASCTMGKNVDLESRVAQAVSEGFKNVTLLDAHNTIIIPTQSPDGTMLGNISFTMPSGWVKKGERVASENTDAPETIEQKYAGKEGELTLTNLYQGGACPTDGGYVTVKSDGGVTFNVCYSREGAVFNSVEINGKDNTDVFGGVQFNPGIDVAQQKDFIQKLLLTAVKGK